MKAQSRCDIAFRGILVHVPLVREKLLSKIAQIPFKEDYPK